MTRYISICSGIEAASVAWGPLGWRPVGFAEIDAFPCAVLVHRFPGVPNFGDFTKIRDRADFADIARATDVLIGGTPCQAFSVAGNRGGLADERGNLTIQFVRLANAIDAVRSASGLRHLIIVWENVPGVLSMHDNAFGCFIGALVDGDAPLVPGGKQRWTDAGLAAGPRRAAAWRILDAQFFGVAQRRERVFVVASGRKSDPGEILFERASGGGNTASRSEAAAVVAPLTACGAGGGGGPDFRDAAAGHLIAFALRGRDGGAMPEIHGDGQTAGALRASAGGSSNDYVAGGGVRRLTPTEKEALQGFPRGWTCVPFGRARAIDNDEVDYLRGQGANVWQGHDGRWRTSAAADGPRGEALGNSMAVPVIRWIGERIDKNC